MHRPFRRTSLFSLFIVTIFATGVLLFHAQASKASVSFAENFKPYLENGSLSGKTGAPIYQDDLKKFYEARQYEPVWFTANGREKTDIDELNEALQNQARLNGLKPEKYDLSQIVANFDDNAEGDALFDREWMLTSRVMHYVSDIRSGRIAPGHVDPKIFLPTEKRALDQRAAVVLSSGNFEDALVALEPPHEEYQVLKKALVQYREMAEEDATPDITMSQEILEPGESSDIVPQIRTKLAQEYRNYDGKLPGDMWIDKGQIDGESFDEVVPEVEQPSESKSASTENADKAQDSEISGENFYDSELAKKVAEFQYYHGLKTDGVIGPETIRALNQSHKNRADKILLAMERWRWLPDDLGDKHVMVNIAGFYARAVEGGEQQLMMPTIVGEVAHQTPVFSSVIENVKLHPDWTAPDSIAERYLIDKIQNNPAVIEELGYHLVNKSTGETLPIQAVGVGALDNLSLDQYMFRQKPGRKNALGMVRFSVKNDYAIFLHGTPSENLFGEDDRTFSSGCIRLAEPFEMAYFLLKDQMGRDELKEMYEIGENEHPDTTFLDLEKDVPVHLTYQTAWVDDGGNVRFAEDIYGRDEKLKNAIYGEGA
jgi:murein L,D-transpeptidase YcbB/YkuD